MEKELNLNQFQTDSNLAEKLFQIIKNSFDKDNNKFYIEPSAGEGSFYNILPQNRRAGVDIDTDLQEKYPEYIFSDFLKTNAKQIFQSKAATTTRENIIVIGNPPFSLRSTVKKGPLNNRLTGGSKNMSLLFINHAATMADTVCMILGCNMRKLSIQEKVNNELHLVHEEILSSQLWKNSDKQSFGLKKASKRVTDINAVF